MTTTTAEPTISIAATGVTFDGRDAHLDSVTTGERVALMPQPDNPADADAIAIYRWIDGELVHAGYVPAGLAKRLTLGRFGCVAHVGDLRFHDGNPRGFDVVIPKRHLNRNG